MVFIPSLALVVKASPSLCVHAAARWENVMVAFDWAAACGSDVVFLGKVRTHVQTKPERLLTQRSLGCFAKLQQRKSSSRLCYVNLKTARQKYKSFGRQNSCIRFQVCIQPFPLSLALNLKLQRLATMHKETKWSSKQLKEVARHQYLDDRIVF